MNPPDQPHPTIEACLAMWKRVDFTPHIGSYPRLGEFIEALRKVYDNGKVIHHAFNFPSDDIFDWYASRGKFHEMNFFERLWKTSSVLAAIPQQLDDLNFYSPKIFEHSSPFLLGGFMAWTLAVGGAYEKHAAGPADAKRMADAAADELIKADYDSPLVFSARKWSDFFFDVAWDETWVVVLPKERLVHVILATDTD